jgi:hypothetical protein
LLAREHEGGLQVPHQRLSSCQLGSAAHTHAPTPMPYLALRGRTSAQTIQDVGVGK